MMILLSSPRPHLMRRTATPGVCLLVNAATITTRHTSNAILADALHHHHHSINWNDRIGLQSTFTNKEKGWLVDVEWRPTAFGAGLFANCNIPRNTKLRTGVLDKNLLQVTSMNDIEDFVYRGGRGDDKDDHEGRLRYVADYLWGFDPVADERGYELPDRSLMDVDRFFGFWVPGNGLNHNQRPNTVYRKSDYGIDLYALEDIRADEELYDDYRRHGSAPNWLLEFSEKYGMSLNFAECNTFVDNNDGGDGKDH